MSMIPNDPLASPASEADRPKRPWAPLGRLLAAIAWCVVIGTIVVAFIPAAEEIEQQAPTDEIETDGENDDLVLSLSGRVTTGLEGRSLVGMADFFPAYRQQSITEAELGLRAGTLGERLAYVTVIGALGDRGQASEALLEVLQTMAQADYEPPRQAREVIESLSRIYTSGSSVLSDDQVSQLHKQLGWFGALAVSTDEDSAAADRSAVIGRAQRTIMIAGGFGLLAIGGVVVGGIGLILMIVFGREGRLRWRLGLGPNRQAFDGVAIETFAIWLIWFFFLQWLASIVATAAEASPIGALLLTAAAFFLSIDALLGWPLLRGVSWRELCRWSGFNSGGALWREVWWGVAGYVMALPIVAIGFAITLLLMNLSSGGSATTDDPFAPVDAPLHPVNLLMVGADVWVYLTIVLVAAVCAPIVEELAFRGFFYRHLRAFGRGLGVFGSVIVSTLVTSFFFAAIHPQGWLAIPLLMALAIAFALLREWRGSLVAPMVAHAVNNFIVVSFGVLLLS